jgi:hypothetical protein
VISEIGADVREFFPDAAHLASWTGLCPGNHESAGKRRSGRRRKGNAHLQSLLVECAWSAVRHEGYLKSLYHRHVMKWGGYRSQLAKKKAIVVVAHALIVIIWHILATGKPYDELGADYFASRLDPERETRRLIARLEALGHQVSLQPAACPHTASHIPEPTITGRGSLPRAWLGTIHVSVHRERDVWPRDGRRTPDCLPCGSPWAEYSPPTAYRSCSAGSVDMAPRTPQPPSNGWASRQVGQVPWLRALARSAVAFSSRSASPPAVGAAAADTMIPPAVLQGPGQPAALRRKVSL